MNPALTPLSRIREMSNAELVAFAKEHSSLTILEREFLRRMDGVVQSREIADNYTASQVEKDALDWYNHQTKTVSHKVGILNGAIVRGK